MVGRGGHMKHFDLHTGMVGVAPAPAGGGVAPLVNTDIIVQENQTQAPDEVLLKLRTVSGSHRKTAEALKVNVGAIVNAAGVQNCVFFTPTLANLDHKAPDPERANNCWRRMEKMVVAEWPNGGVRILERGGKTQRLHYHVLLDVGVDVRSGYDFTASRAEQSADRRAKWSLHPSANAQLVEVESKLRIMARRAGFGVIFHCEPIRSEVEAVREYLSKYICKHVGQRLLIDKRRRLVGYFGQGASRRDIPSASSFAFGGELVQNKGTHLERPHFRNAWAWLWRKKVGQWMARRGIKDMDEAREVLGKRWAYRHGAEIRDELLKCVYPYAWIARMDGRIQDEDYKEMMGGMWCDSVKVTSSPVIIAEPHGPDGVVEFAGKWHNSAEVLDISFRGHAGKTVVVLADDQVVEGGWGEVHPRKSLQGVEQAVS